MTLLMRDNEMKAEGRAEGRIQQAIKMYKKFGYNQEDAIKEIMDEFSLSKEEAEEYYSKYSPSIES